MIPPFLLMYIGNDLIKIGLSEDAIDGFRYGEDQYDLHEVMSATPGGFTNLYIYDVPTPIGLPFAYFPSQETKEEAGLIIPNVNESKNRGYSLQNGGYYLPISEFLDLTILGDYYTNGSYGLNISSVYNKRYKYTGNFGIRYENLINGERGLPEYSKSTIYNVF